MEDLQDSATGPIKTGAHNTHEVEGSEGSYRKKLDMNLTEESGDNSMEAGPREGEAPTAPLPPPYVKTKDLKKAKKVHNQDTEFENLASSAAFSRMTAGPNVSSRLELSWVRASCDSSRAGLPCTVL
jgi:hypothetical protein